MGPSLWQLLIILVIVLLLFGTKRMRNLGSDLGTAIKGFRSAINEGEKDDSHKLDHERGETIDVEVNSKDKSKGKD